MVNRVTRSKRKVLKSTNEYTIFEKRNGRQWVTATGGATISGFEKAQILFKEGFLKVKPQPEHYNVYVAPVEEEAPVAEEQSAA
jgi:hypothetical protein